ncbi:ABC transporter substrate-binding protein [Qipengyuania sediminis]|uniref:ABC transporter substrate-binding protein n=1 Tax=Qipengyuania sediminis TaxID=1532023 RepID=UPI001F118A8B|nr:ABC transporter substrate-binding protein [Qipengyuania sediminis]
MLLLSGCTARVAYERSTARPTIVSLNPCTDAILAEVADPAQLLAISHYSHDPRQSSMDVAAARSFRATGGTAEEVAALAPDIVVGSAFMAPATRTALERLGMRTVNFGAPATIDESIAQVRSLAALAGNPASGEALVRRIEAAAAPVPGPRIEAALWQAGGIVPGRGTLVSDLLSRAGFTSYPQARGMAQGDYLPLERIAVDPPQVLLVAGEDRGQRHPLLARIPGLTAARFDPSLFYCGGPSIPKAMERLRGIRRALAPLQPAGRGVGGPEPARAHPAATGTMARARLAAPTASGRGE